MARPEPDLDDLDDDEVDPPKGKADPEEEAAKSKIKGWLAEVLDEREAKGGKPKSAAARKRTEAKKSSVWNQLFGG